MQDHPHERLDQQAQNHLDNLFEMIMYLAKTADIEWNFVTLVQEVQKALCHSSQLLFKNSGNSKNKVSNCEIAEEALTPNFITKRSSCG